jgi:hypothetical protein
MPKACIPAVAPRTRKSLNKQNHSYTPKNDLPQICEEGLTSAKEGYRRVQTESSYKGDGNQDGDDQ